MALKRIHCELLSVCDGKEDEKHVAIMVADPENLFNLRGIIISPPGAPTEGFIFFLNIKLPHDYPFGRPRITFWNGMWHPKVSIEGGPQLRCRDHPICMLHFQGLGLSLTLETIMVSIQAMLRNPGEDLDKPDSGILNPAANHQYLRDQVAYAKTAKEWAGNDNEGYGQVAFWDHRISAIQSVLMVPGVINYEGHVFSTKQGSHTWKITVVITPNLVLYRQSVEGLYPIPNRHQQLKITGFHFNFERTLSPEIVIDVGKGTSLDGCWNITTVGADCKIQKSDIDSFIPRQNTPATCELTMEWIRKEREPHRLIHKLHVNGTKSPFNSFDICIDPKDYTHESHRNPDRPTLPQLLKCPVKGGRKDVNVPSQIGSKYFEFGVFLLNDETGSIVNGIDKDKKGNEDINREIIRRWLMGQGKQPITWETLKDVLRDIGLSVLAADINLP